MLRHKTCSTILILMINHDLIGKRGHRFSCERKVLFTEDNQSQIHNHRLYFQRVEYDMMDFNRTKKILSNMRTFCQNINEFSFYFLT